MANEFENRWRELGEFIREQRNVGHLSLRKLSEMAGVSNPYLSQIERGLRKPSAEILQQIANALQISAETLYVQAGILELIESLCRDSGMSLLLVTHDLGVVAALADRIAVMQSGRIVESATAAEFMRGPKEAYSRSLLESVLTLEGVA